MCRAPARAAAAPRIVCFRDEAAARCKRRGACRLCKKVSTTYTEPLCLRTSARLYTCRLACSIFFSSIFFRHRVRGLGCALQYIIAVVHYMRCHVPPWLAVGRSVLARETTPDLSFIHRPGRARVGWVVSYTLTSPISRDPRPPGYVPTPTQAGCRLSGRGVTSRHVTSSRTCDADNGGAGRCTGGYII